MVFSNLRRVPAEKMLPGVKVRHIYLKGMLVSVVEYEPNAMLVRHEDTGAQISIVLEGEVEAVVGKEKKRVKAGGIVFVPPHTPHSMRAFKEGAKVVCTSSPVTKPYVFEPLPDIYERDRSGDW
jgi:quercetin dioxygenase-like cupin family protein